MANNLDIRDATALVKTVKTTEAGSVHTPHHNVDAQPARSRTLDAIAAALQTDALMSGLTVLTPKFAKVGAATLGNNTLINTVSSKKIRVLAALLVPAAAVNLYFDDSNGTVLCGDSTNKIQLTANNGFVLGFSPVGWFETAAGFALRVNLSGAVALSGVLVYEEV